METCRKASERREALRAEAAEPRSENMAEVILKNIKKVYPNSEPKKKNRDSGEKKHNLQITDEGVVAVQEFNLDIADREFIVLVGPSGCGKSTLLRTFNRMYALYPGQRAEGELMLDGGNILSGTIDDCTLRSRVGMVFQRPTPFPMSIYDNIAYGIRLRENVAKSELDDRVEWALKKAALWNDVKDKLREPGTSLSGGQQQRLCIARGVAVKPEVLLLDEPCSALDPISTARIEELIEELKNDYTVVIVTHSMQQAARVSDYTAFLYLGELIETGPTTDIFTRPQKKATEDYITGRFG